MDPRVDAHFTVPDGAPATRSAACDRRAPGSDMVLLPADAQERARRRLAFDLHDGPLQSLLAGRMQLRMLLSRLPVDLADEGALLEDTLSYALRETYEVIEELRPKALDASGLASKVTAYVEDRSADFDFDITIDVEGDEPHCSPSLQLSLFRVVQEALSNCSRHACANSVRVSIFFGEMETRCLVTDDGKGFEPDRPVDDVTRHYGMMSMRERVEMLGGQLSVVSFPGMGTSVCAAVPRW